MTHHTAGDVVATILAMAIQNACQLGRNLPLICSRDVELKARQSRVLESGEMTLHFNTSLMTSEMSFWILDLAIQTRQSQSLQNVADILRQLRKNNLTPLYSVPLALSLSVVVVSSTSMSKLTIATSNAKNLAALLVAFIEFKISNVTLQFGTALVAEVESAAGFQDVHRPSRGLQDKIITYATFDRDIPLAKIPAQSSITILFVQADRASPHVTSETSCKEEASCEPLQHYLDWPRRCRWKLVREVEAFCEPLQHYLDWPRACRWKLLRELEAFCELFQRFMNRPQEYGRRSEISCEEEAPCERLHLYLDWPQGCHWKLLREVQASCEPFQHYLDWPRACRWKPRHEVEAFCELFRRFANRPLEYGRRSEISCGEEACYEPLHLHWDRLHPLHWDWLREKVVPLASTFVSRVFSRLYNPTQSFPSLFDSLLDDDAMGSIVRMIWTDECSRKAPYIIVYHGCPSLSWPAKLFWIMVLDRHGLRIKVVDRRGLRIKDWQNAHGKVGRPKSTDALTATSEIRKPASQINEHLLKRILGRMYGWEDD